MEVNDCNSDRSRVYLLTVVLSAIREHLRTLRTFTDYCHRLPAERSNHLNKIITDIKLVEEDFRSLVGLESDRDKGGKSVATRLKIDPELSGKAALSGREHLNFPYIDNINDSDPKQISYPSPTISYLPLAMRRVKSSPRTSSPSLRTRMQTRSQTRRMATQEPSQISDWYRVKKNLPGTIRAKKGPALLSKSSGKSIITPRIRKRTKESIDKTARLRREAAMELALSRCTCPFLHKLPDLLKASSCFLSFTLSPVENEDIPIKSESSDNMDTPCCIKCQDWGFNFSDASNRSTLKPIVKTLDLLHNKTHSLLSASPTTTRHANVAEGIRDTAQWLSEDDRFQSWRVGGPQNILWLTGPAGSGKTVLSRSMSTYIDHARQPFDILASYFYEGPGEQSSMSTVLLSLVTQIVLPVGQNDVIPLHSLVDGSSGDILDDHDFESIFRLVTDLVSSTTQLRLFLVLDGFDDEDENARSILHKILPIVSSSPQIRCLVTSTLRASMLQPELDEATIISIDLAKESQVQRQLLSFAKTCMDDVIPSNVVETPKRETFLHMLCEKAQSFLWIKLATEELSTSITSCNVNEVDIEAQIKTLPEDLEPLYRSRLERILPGCLRIAKKVFSWIICAIRPLNLFEMLDALQLKTNFITAPNMHQFPLDDPSRGLDLVCGGLVIIGENSKLQFVHNSVRAFLLSGALLSTSVAKYSISWFQANENVARDCLDYLSRRDRAISPKNSSSTPSQRAALEYVQRYWLRHYKSAEAYSQSLAGCLHRLLEDHKLRVLEWSNIVVDEVARCYMVSAETPLFFCASFGLEGLARMLLAAGNDPEAMIGGRTALHLAANNGHANIVRLLLERGIEVGMKTFPEGKNAIELAQQNGKLEIVNLLCYDGIGDQMA